MESYCIMRWIVSLIAIIISLLSIFLFFFHGNFVSRISQELLQTRIIILVNKCRIGDCIIRSRHGVMALSFPFLLAVIENLCQEFSRWFSQVVLQLESWNLVYVWLMSCDIV